MSTIHVSKTAKKSTKSTKSNAHAVSTSVDTAASSVPVAAGAAAQTAISPPVPGTTVPTPPQGFVASDMSEFRGFLPKATQLTTLPDVLKELGRFTNYAEVFGMTAPPLAWMLQTFDAANQWSQMRAKNEAWDAYTKTQEGMAWTDVHKALVRVQPALDLAVQADASVGTQYPALVRLCDAASVIAQKGAATRRSNKKKTAAGELPTSGKVGKRRQKAAANTALEEKSAAATATAPTGVAAASGTQATAAH